MKFALKFMIGFGIFIGILSLIMLFMGEWGAFFGFMIFGLGFTGMGWAVQRIFLPKEGENPRMSISLIIKAIFGSAGVLMLIGSILLLVDGEIGGAIGLSVFGLVFCLVAYFGSRVFAIPKGAKEVLVGQRIQSISGVLGQTGKRTGSSYIYVDESVPDSEIEKMQKEWQEKPWTQRADWAEGRVIQQGPGSMKLLIGFTIVWNIIGWGIAAFALISEWASDDIPWFVLVFPAFGIALIYVTVRTWIRQKKYGISILHLITLPAWLGDVFRGKIKTGVSVKTQSEKEYKIELICVRRSSYRDREGKQRVSEKKLWGEEQILFGSVSNTGKTFDVIVNFFIPDDQPPTELYPEDDRTYWQLNISSKEKGVDYAAQFEIPVYKKK
ncbi:MAG TPA: hypothetical protein ENO27_02685 [Caldithrix sp.]|nr:hypothetical protein [candidate division KSB1 bacterium]HEM49097.1 hypothetical protein [Caldithrix sp.]HES59597.1 hypothetical protein [Caldithrix sp.]